MNQETRSPAGATASAERADAPAGTGMRQSARPGIAPLTLEQKIGQMVMMGMAGTGPDDAAVKSAIGQIAAGTLGGVILYGYNVVSPGQVGRLTAALSGASTSGLPLLVAVDQEGGLVQRLKASNGFASTPSAEEIAGGWSPEGAYYIYSSMASMLREAGFTLNLGPVADLRGDPADPERKAVSPVIGQLGRSFSEDPAVVEAYASAFVRAHRDAGMLTALKHFPGHGLATADSHLGLVDITLTARPVEREPFRALLAAGKGDAVMTAHLVDRNRDPDNPVTLSAGFLETELRAADGFDGVVITDDLHMGAIQLHHGFEETVLKAIAAGNDLLIFSNNPAAAKNVPGFQPDYGVAVKVIDVVMRAIGRGELAPGRIEKSWARLVALRSRF